MDGWTRLEAVFEAFARIWPLPRTSTRCYAVGVRTLRRGLGTETGVYCGGRVLGTEPEERETGSRGGSCLYTAGGRAGAVCRKTYR